VPAAPPRARPDVDGVVRRAQHVEVVLDDQPHAFVQVGDDGLGDEPRLRGGPSLERVDPRGELDERQPREVDDGEAGDGDAPALGAQAGALAVRAGLVEQQPLHLLAVVRVLDAGGVAPQQVGDTPSKRPRATVAGSATSGTCRRNSWLSTPYSSRSRWTAPSAFTGASASKTKP
jgi:hypothetical protein